ncbi:hypothetical protein [Actinomadura opuntiae]|uniref:hypothetical protein n=1 Tax=Actinomadura sp. OS1-43 TaxID=604315 RepID=UPI00255ACCF2|nr:hypothetical protein [Actinomadura sp. OS1-43]MDL4812728.1 hypothetical protein [Actinomadura sp. OS1-43]
MNENMPTRPADLRRPLPADVIARCADTDSAHGFPTVVRPLPSAQDYGLNGADQ